MLRKNAHGSNELNLKIGGGLDDVWQNTQTGELHVVDYKSTSQKTPGRTITLMIPIRQPTNVKRICTSGSSDAWDLTSAILGIFCMSTVIATHRDFLGADEALMVFKPTLITYEVDGWIKSTLVAIKQLLDGGKRPPHFESCQYGNFLAAASKA